MVCWAGGVAPGSDTVSVGGRLRRRHTPRHCAARLMCEALGCGTHCEGPRVGQHMTRYLFAPGCALVLYKPRFVDRLLAYLRSDYGDVDLLLTCCRHTPAAAIGRCVINVCPGCDRRYRENYAAPSTISLWEILAESDGVAFPDYGGRQMTILDACPTRDQPRVHNAIRGMAERMNIALVEPEKTRANSTCCGDVFYGELPAKEVLSQMRAKAAQMPLDNVIVYCVSCAKSMFNGGISPRYILDLLFDEETTPGICDPDEWHRELDRFIAAHNDAETNGPSGDEADH